VVVSPLEKGKEITLKKKSKSVPKNILRHLISEELLEVDIAIDPCEEINLIAYGQNGSMIIFAMNDFI
jgi:fructose-1,6-bisphosphatase/sedoheptulose 1,7-bisphosphatase-like protein